MNTIRDVEIFATGTHNGDDYTERDLDDMVAAFRELDYRPALKIGHTKDAPGAPAYGWIENLRRVGKRLLADFTDMHDSVVDAIRKRLYDNVSAEIYFNLKRAGKTFRRALKAVALLGAEVPAVANLTPLHKMQFAAEGDYDAVAFVVQSFNLKEENVEVQTDAGQEVDRRVRAYWRARGIASPALVEANYSEAMQHVLAESPELAAKYARLPTERREHDGYPYDDVLISRQAAGDDVDVLTRRKLRDHPGQSYTDAMAEVLSEHPDLRDRYQGQTISGVAPTEESRAGGFRRSF
jgi:hypothetical protein